MEKWWGSISAQTKSDTKIVRRAEENIAQTKKKICWSAGELPDHVPAGILEKGKWVTVNLTFHDVST